VRERDLALVAAQESRKRGAAVRVQRKFARARNIPWGFSESGLVIPGQEDYGYAPCGHPELALKPLDARTLVVSPYSSYLALLVDGRAATENLRLLARLGCVVGGMLTKAGRDVTLIDQWPEHVETMKRQGLKLSGTCGDHVVRVKAIHVESGQPVEFGQLLFELEPADSQPIV